MKITQQFVVARPLETVWTFFKDIPRVAACMPGAEYLGQSSEGRHLGKVTTKVGPFQTSFEGEAEVAFDDALKQVTSNGKGVDKKGASRGKMLLVCALAPEGVSTRVSIDADVQLSGAIAQFGRTSLLTEVASVMIASFVQNVEAGLAPVAVSSPAVPDEAGAAAPSAAPAPLSVVTLFVEVLQGWITKLFGRRA